ncbi:MAG: hypothetical protein U9N84_05840, partial [Actinomycetota bacterium]|nr:hypothetical protein [Actinomycetota bacterium]
ASYEPHHDPGFNELAVRYKDHPTGWTRHIESQTRRTLKATEPDVPQPPQVSIRHLCRTWPRRTWLSAPLLRFPLVETAAIIAAALMGVVAVFQIALTLGAPARYAAWGGWHEGTLPTRLRVASGFAGFLVYPALMVFVLATARVVEVTWVPGTGKVGMWILTGVFVLGTLANFASRSRRERYWGVVSLAIAICCAFVAIQV